MKYNIFKYSQRAACGFVKEVTEKGKIKTIRLDITDLAILSWFSDFYPSMWKANINGVEYALLVHSKLRDDMPILGISKEGCRARMDKLVEFGILEYKCVKGVLAYHKENQRDEKTGTFSLYAFGPNYMRLVEDRVQGQTNEGYGFKPIRGTGSNPYQRFFYQRFFYQRLFYQEYGEIPIAEEGDAPQVRRILERPSQRYGFGEAQRGVPH